MRGQAIDGFDKLASVAGQGGLSGGIHVPARRAAAHPWNASLASVTSRLPCRSARGAIAGSGPVRTHESVRRPLVRPTPPAARLFIGLPIMRTTRCLYQPPREGDGLRRLPLTNIGLRSYLGAGAWSPGFRRQRASCLRDVRRTIGQRLRDLVRRHDSRRG
jgi:hypothetical protein